MLPLLENKVVFVSGGSQGLSAAVARAAAREGAEAVVVTGRRAERGEKLVAELAERGATARFVQADVGDVGQAQAAVATAVAQFGRVDCLVNSAGLTARGTLLDTTPELFDADVAVNLRGPYFTMQAVVRDIGWTDSEGEDAAQREFHGADDDWRAKAAASVPMGKLGQVDEIADFAVFLLSVRSGVVTGSVIEWDQAVVGGSD